MIVSLSNYCKFDRTGKIQKLKQMKKESLRFRILMISLILLFPGFSNGLRAEEDGTGSIIIKKCNDFKVTGYGKDESWNGTRWINLNRQDQGKSDYTTQVKVLYSGTGIYFLFSCEDKKLTSTLKADNLDLFKEDVAELFLWTDESFPVYFEYEISPMNYELPIMVPNNRGTFLGWLPWHYEGEKKTLHATSVQGGKMESGASVKGWTAEFFIPYKLLAPLGNVPPVSGTKWRANMYRIDYDNGATHFSWQKTSGSFHEYNRFGTFIFE
jgi:hypothetical protein